MPVNIKEIAQAWEQDEPKYKELGKAVAGFIKEEITLYEILPEVTYRPKELLSIIKKIKKKQREKKYDYENLNDKLGIRIVCTFIEDLEKVDVFLRENFNIKNIEYKKEALDFDKLDYISNHYDASVKSDLKAFRAFDKYKDLVFEIQVRTLNQHAWSNTAHSLSYKQEADIAPLLKRRVYRLLSLYEIADDEFSAVNKALLSNPDNKVYALLRKLEGKIYKFGRVDFDRETTLYTLRTLLNFFSDEEMQQLLIGIDDFIAINEAKIQGIFAENQSRYHEIPLLTQPEIFVIWFALEKFPFSIDDNWDNEFDRSELEQIQTLWGKIID
jgi:putative GTP pyrophosphokinase